MSRTLDLVLNDLSFVPMNSRTEAIEKMSDLVQLLSIFAALKVGSTLRCSELLYQLPLYNNYNVANWSVDPHVARDEQTLFKTKAVKSPYLQDEPLAYARSHGCQFILENESCDGLGAAYLLDLPSVSLLSTEKWNKDKIVIVVNEIDENHEIIEYEEEVIHAASIDHIRLHRSWIQDQFSTPVRKGKDLWTNREILFPNLEFCVEIEAQLDALIMPAYIHQVRVRLGALNDYDDEWTSERMFAVLPDFSGESDTTLGTRRASRTFSRSNGESAFCEWHMKMKKSFNWRIHFYVDFKNQKIIVGYIGPHLPI